MKALMSNLYKRKEFAGKWVEIDTTCLFDNQYNTTEEYGNLRIFDGDIVRIVDDARIGKGTCRYCGKLVTKGNEEEHFAEMEKRKAECSMSDIETKSCFWKSRHYIGETEIKRETKEEVVDGVAHTIVIRTMEQQWIPYCSHEEIYGGCTHDEHRKMGIKWFTEENCFFLKYPDGLPSMEIKPLSEDEWRIYGGGFRREYIGKAKNKLGSYKLSIKLDNTNHLGYFCLANARNSYRFYRINDYYAVLDGIANSPRIVPKLLDHSSRAPKVNEQIEKVLAEILNEVMAH